MQMLDDKIGDVFHHRRANGNRIDPRPRDHNRQHRDAGRGQKKAHAADEARGAGIARALGTAARARPDEIQRAPGAVFGAGASLGIELVGHASL
jgi:hypothetical protein